MCLYELAVEIWEDKEISNDAELAEALNGHSIAFAYHSGNIENSQITYNDTREIFEHDGVTSYTGDLRTLFEMRNSKDANELLLSAFNERRPIDEDLIKEIQYCLTKIHMIHADGNLVNARVNTRNVIMLQKKTKPEQRLRMFMKR